MVKFSEPDHTARQHSQRLREFIFDEIESKSGRITFARYMELALYAPGLGYYSAGAQKFGKTGDFVTAPEISVLFSQCLARQCQQVLEVLNGGSILEIGAGSGKMALDLLLALERQNCLPHDYKILEVSADLRHRQQILFKTQAPHLYKYITWLDSLCIEAFKGLILANEVLDALPAHRFQWDAASILREWYVSRDGNALVWELGEPGGEELIRAVQNLCIPAQAVCYNTEINLILPSWINSLGACLNKGLIIVIDYGFPRAEYYHVDRNMGTLMCHYQHQAHGDPFRLPGLQDISVHVDFTAVAESGVNADLCVGGYTTQAAFLLSCGLLDLASSLSVLEDTRRRFVLNQEIHQLTSPAEMGELFKVMALSRGLEDVNLLGFILQDQRGRL